jgi:hypothetical protein
MRAYPLTSEELVDDVFADLDRVTEAVRARFAPLAPAQLAWQPDAASWGIGHCLVHLATLAAVYHGPLTAALGRERSRGRAPRGRLRGTWFGRWFTRMNAPGARRMRTLGVLQPRPESVADGSVALFLAEQQRLRAVALEARGLDLDAVRLASPLSSWVRLTGGDALRTLAAHELRHLAQAERVVAHPRFPG